MQSTVSELGTAVMEKDTYMARRANASSPDRARAASRSCPGAGADAGAAAGGSGGFCCIASTAFAAACRATCSSFVWSSMSFSRLCMWSFTFVSQEFHEGTIGIQLPPDWFCVSKSLLLRGYLSQETSHTDSFSDCPETDTSPYDSTTGCLMCSMYSTACKVVGRVANCTAN